MPQPRRCLVALGVVALVEVLLALTALQKLVVPAPAALALRQIGLRIPLSLVRLGAAAELVAGLGALASGKPVFIALVALCYTGFAVFIAIALRRPDPISSCGCLGPLRTGGADTPPTAGHLAFNLAAAALCIVATVWPAPGGLAAFRHQPLAGIPLLGLVALGCWLSWTLLTVAPQTAAAAAATATAARSSNSQA